MRKTLVLLLFFGGKKIPELMKGLGRGVKDFKEAQNGIVQPEPSAETADQVRDMTEKADRGTV